MSNIFRPTFAIIQELHSVVNARILKEIETLAAETWAKFPCTATPEEAEAFRESVREKIASKQPGRIIYTFDVFATRTGDEK